MEIDYNIITIDHVKITTQILFKYYNNLVLYFKLGELL